MTLMPAACASLMAKELTPPVPGFVRFVLTHEDLFGSEILTLDQSSLAYADTFQC